MQRDTHHSSPGVLLERDFLKPLGLTQKQLADHMGCDVKVINRIVNGRCAVTADMAVRLGAALGTGAAFWLDAQNAIDIARAMANGVSLPLRIGIAPPQPPSIRAQVSDSARAAPVTSAASAPRAATPEAPTKPSEANWRFW